MLRWQACKFVLLPNGEQIRNMRKFFGCRRVIFNKALARNEEMYQRMGKKHTRFQLDKLIPKWKKMGVAVFATMSDNSTSVMPDTSRLEERKKFLQRRLKNKVRFSANWRKLQQRIKKVDRRISNVRDNHRHQFTNTITKNHGIVYGDDLEIKNMTKSAKGTKEQPGKNVRQKAALNRSMQKQGIAEVNRLLKYKSEWRGGLYIPCPPQYGSQHCPSCGHTSKENRKTQERFQCTNPKCQFTANADWVAALNKLEAGRAFLACGEFPSWTRFGASLDKLCEAGNHRR